MSLNQSLLVGLISVAFFSYFFVLARKRLLAFDYFVKWVGICSLGFVAIFLLPIVVPMSSMIGVTPGVLVSGIAICVVVLIIARVTTDFSRLMMKVENLNELLVRVDQNNNLDLKCLNSENQVAIPLVIIPAFNEEHTVGQVVKGAIDLNFSVVVVDDGSTDSTGLVAKEAGASVIEMPFNAGVGAALRVGLRFAAENGFDIVVQCDADGQHPPSYIPQLVERANQVDSDLMIGSRFTGLSEQAMSVGATRRLAQHILARSASKKTGYSITDSTSGFRVFRGNIIPILAKHMPTYYLGDTYETVIAVGRAGYKVAEFPAPIQERQHGASSANPIQALRLTLKVLILVMTGLNTQLPERIQPE